MHEVRSFMRGMRDGSGAAESACEIRLNVFFRRQAGGWTRGGRRDLEKAGPQGRAKVSEEAQGRDERGGAGPRRARSKWRREHHRASGRFGTTGPRRLSTSSSPVFNTSSKSYGRRRVLGGATGALGALPGGGASGAGRGGRRQREAVAARGAQAGQAAKGRRRRSTELRRRAPCSSRRNGPRRRRAEMSETAQGRDERGGAGLR